LCPTRSPTPTIAVRARITNADPNDTTPHITTSAPTHGTAPLPVTIAATPKPARAMPIRSMTTNSMLGVMGKVRRSVVVSFMSVLQGSDGAGPLHRAGRETAGPELIQLVRVRPQLARAPRCRRSRTGCRELTKDPSVNGQTPAAVTLWTWLPWAWRP